MSGMWPSTNRLIAQARELLDKREVTTPEEAATRVLGGRKYEPAFSAISEGLKAQGYEALGKCVLCGEQVMPSCLNGDPAEMHGALKPRYGTEDVEVDSGLVHAQCGLDAGWEIS